MDQKHSASETAQRPSLKLPAKIVFLTAIFLFSFISAVNPLGLIGLPLAILAAGMNIVFALDCTKSKGWLAVLLGFNLIPFAAAFVYMSSVPLALAALLPCMLGMPVWLTISSGKSRAISIVSAAICAFLLFSLYFALAITAEYGTCSPQTISTMLDESFIPIKEKLSELTYEYEGEKIAYYNDTDLENIMYTVKSLMIGVLASIMICTGYFSTLAARVIANTFGLEELLPMGMRVSIRVTVEDHRPVVNLGKEKVQWRLELDSITAWVYIGAYILTILLGNSNDTLYLCAAMQNLLIILSPGFFYCGIRDIILGFRGKASCGRISRAALIFGIILIFINPMTVLLLICVMGVTVVLHENKMRRDALRQSTPDSNADRNDSTPGPFNSNGKE